MIDRRAMVGAATLLTLLGGGPALASVPAMLPWGSVGKVKAKPGQRTALADLIAAGAADMPGSLSYAIAMDLGDPDGLWVFETWTEKAAHDLALERPAVRDAIAKARPLIAAFDTSAELRVVYGAAVGVR